MSKEGMGIYIIEIDDFNLLHEALTLVGIQESKLARVSYDSATKWAVRLSGNEAVDLARYVGKIRRYNQEEDDPHKIIYGRLN